MKDSQREELLKIKRFGYVISAILVIISNISLINVWAVTPVLFLITMYFLTAALWIPVLIKPFYKMFEKIYRRSGKKDDSKNSKDYFLQN